MNVWFNVSIFILLPLHNCQIAYYWIFSQFHQNQSHIYQFLERRWTHSVTVFWWPVACPAVWNIGRTYPSPRRPGWWTSQCDTDLGRDRPPHSSISLDMNKKKSIKSSSLHYLPRELGLLTIKSNQDKPLVTPFVERQPCHSLNSLLWQHNPSGPMAGKTKQDVMVQKWGEEPTRWGAPSNQTACIVRAWKWRWINTYQRLCCGHRDSSAMCWKLRKDEFVFCVTFSL